MTTYLSKRNRAVRFIRLREAAFEVFISSIPALQSIATVIVWLVIVGGLVWGVAGWEGAR